MTHNETAIAAAMCKNSRILILDESTSELDTESELYAFSNDSIVAVWQRQDEILGQRGLCGGNDSFFGNVGESVTNVVPHGVVKEDVFLGDHRDLLTQRLDGDVADIHAVNPNVVGGGLVKLRQ